MLATDILPMEPIKNVDFIQGDFTDEAVVAQLLEWLGGGKFDLIISDIAPNITGIDSADQASSMYFLELALDTVRQTLKPGATFVAKMFQGSGSDQYVKDLRTSFEKVLIRKPAASRAESREVYIVAKGFKWWIQGLTFASGFFGAAFSAPPAIASDRRSRISPTDEIGARFRTVVLQKAVAGAFELPAAATRLACHLR